MSSNIKFSLKTTLLTLLGCGLATLLTFIQLVIFGADSSDFLMMNPILSGYLHLSVTHLASNMILIFLALCSRVNQDYGVLKIYAITFLMELIYLPLEIAEVSRIAIGISGTCYFLISRFFFSWKEKAWLGACIVIALASVEFWGFFYAADDAAHGVHIMGIIFGYFSIRREMRHSFKLVAS